MLTALFPKIENTKFTQIVRDFFRSSYYPFIIAALMAISEIFALELPVYYIYLALGAVCIFFCDDTLGILPITCCGYMTYAYKNNPGNHTETTAFGKPAVLLQLYVILGIAVVLLIGRLVFSVIRRPTRKVPSLLLGFVVLGFAYLMAGVGSGLYDPAKALPYGIAQIGSLCVFYFYFYYTVDWERVEKGYIFTVFLAVGVGMLAEIGAMYTHEGAIVKENGIWTVHRGALGTGWGVYNNVGCVMAMCIPAPFYFAVKNEKWGWAFSILGCVFMLGVAFTQSRGSILFGAVVFLACVVAVLVAAKGKNRLLNGVVFGALFLGLAVGFFCFRERFEGIFSAFAKAGLDDSSRFDIYRACVENLKSAPVFGVGFHNSAGYTIRDTLFTPRRAHNTLFQLVASGGEVALIAYIIHRLQTVRLFFRHPNFEKTMAAFIIGALLLTSLVDCNVFNLGPGLLYSCVLVYTECRADAAPVHSEA